MKLTPKLYENRAPKGCTKDLKMINSKMTDAKWWKIGFVRIMAIIVLIISLKGILYNYQHSTLFDFSHFSGPTSMIALIVGLALFAIEIRMERSKHEKTD